MKLTSIETAAGRKKLTSKELSTHLAKVIAKQRTMENSLKGSQNPQSVEVYKKTVAIREFAEAVQAAINGDLIDLRLYED